MGCVPIRRAWASDRSSGPNGVVTSAAAKDELVHGTARLHCKTVEMLPQLQSRTPRGCSLPHRTEERIVSGDSPRLRALPGGQVAIGTYPVGLWMEPVAQMVLPIFRNCEFPKTGKLALYIGIFLFFEQILYKVSSFQWTNRKNCCIIISFLCRGLNAVIYRKR